MKVHKEILKNGIRVVTSHSGENRSLSIIFFVKTGSRNEEKAIHGISHFLEHMVFKGTKNRKTALAISKEIEGMGAMTDAFTSKEYTGFFIKTISKNFEKVIEILADVLLNPLLNPKDIELEKGVVLEEIKRTHQNPAHYIYDLFERVNLDDKRLCQNILGSARTVGQIKKKDFNEYMDKFYHSGNIVVSMAGDIPKNYKSVLEKRLAFFGSSGQSEWASDLSVRKTERILIEERSLAQSSILLGFPGVNYSSSKNIAYKVLSVILGGGMSSRLFQEIREERGLAYHVFCDSENYSDQGSIDIYAGVDSKKVYLTIEAIMKEVRNFANTVKEKELNIAKEIIKGAVAFEQESTYKRAELNGRREIYGLKLKEPDDLIKEVEAVSLAEIKKIARESLSCNPSLAVIGPFKNYEKFAKILK